jgi:hypothetical protein
VIDEDAWRAYLAIHPVLFHVTPARNAEAVLRDGLIPGSRLGVVTRDDFYRTRPCHTYLIKQADIPIVDVFDEPRVVAVDLSQLDPSQVDPDEDSVRERFPEIVKIVPPQPRCDERGNLLPGQAGALAAWAETTEGFDRSEVTERSLTEVGRIAYRGAIPATAISDVQIPSESVGRFHTTLLPEIVGPGLPAIPHQSTWKREVARAHAQAETCARRVCEALGHPDVDINLGDPHKAQRAPEALRTVAIALYGQGRTEAGDAVRAMLDALKIATTISNYAPVSAIHNSGELASACASALNACAQAPEVPAGALHDIAIAAMSAALEVPPSTM